MSDNHQHSKRGFIGFLKHHYETKYVALVWFSVLLVLFAVVQIGYQYSTTGDFIHRGVSLKGGVVMTLPEAVGSIEDVEASLHKSFPGSDLQVRSVSRTKGISIEASEIEPEALIREVSKIMGGLNKDQYSLEVIGSSLGKSFFRELFVSIAMAFLLMGIVVLLCYRTIIPSVAVILAAFCDMIVTVAIYNLTGRTISSAGIAAILMLIGYSVDTDMLLTSRVLRRKEGSVMDRVYSALVTGLTQTTVTLCALLITLFITQSDVIKEVALVLFIGLVADLPMTWIQNVAILRKYMERKGHV